MKLYTIGQVVGARGIKGEIKIYPHTSFPERFAQMSKVLIGKEESEESLEKYVIEAQRVHKDMIILKLLGIDTRNDAEGLVGKKLFVTREELYQLPEDHYYIFDLIGLKVEDKKWGLLGDRGSSRSICCHSFVRFSCKNRVYDPCSKRFGAFNRSNKRCGCSRFTRRFVGRMRIDIITLFPKMFEPVFSLSILGRARRQGSLQIVVHNLRDYTYDRHRTVDDTPYGGGSGMVLKPEPLYDAVEAVKSIDFTFQREALREVVFLTPQGKPFKQDTANELTKLDQLILVCGHYEGFDERARELLADREISIGDFVLTGGEIPAMAVTDAVSRLLPGVLGDEYSAYEESFSEDLLEYPQYTRPRVFRGLEVPEILLSGNHKEIAKWRKKQSIKRTTERRPDLLK